MKVFFYMGRNSQTKSGVSWKIWKIQRTGRNVTTWWGAAELRNRGVVAKGRLQGKEIPFSSLEEAQAHEQRRIKSKLRKGYEPQPRRR
jgi:predicted DNA-binding WGR domain protein